MTITTASKVGLMVFDAVAGQRLGFTIVNALPLGLSYSIFNPDGSILVDNLGIGAGGTGFVDSAHSASLFGAYVSYLRYTGTYTILIDPANNATGTVNITVHTVPPDAALTITPGGPTKTVSITTAGQNGQLTFFGIAGQRISLGQLNSTFTGALTIYEPNGLKFANESISPDSGSNTINRFMDARVLPLTGTYTILIDPFGTATGNIDIVMYDVPPDVTASIVPGGSSVTVSTTIPGQDARLTFSGTAGQRVSLLAHNNSVREISESILSPEGTTLRAQGTMGIGWTGFVDAVTLPTTGTYTALLDANFTPGSMTATLFNVPPDITGNLTINGAAFTVNITAAGQNGTLTFNGNAGQVVTIRVTGNTLSWVTIAMRDPTDQVQVSGSSGNSTFNLIQATLPVTGVYKISVDPFDTGTTPGTWVSNTGSASISVTSP
jgi:hypothetical protein